MEIERRFLVKDMDKVNELVKKYADTKKVIIQDYIYSDKLTAIRKRKMIKNGEIKYLYTIKTGRRGISVNEIEDVISEDIYNSLKKDESAATIDKERYVIPYMDDLLIELDIFHGEYEGLVFAEIEFKSEEQAMATQMPEWFDKEITDSITNNKLARRAVDIKELFK